MLSITLGILFLLHKYYISSDYILFGNVNPVCKTHLCVFFVFNKIFMRKFDALITNQNTDVYEKKLLFFVIS